MARRGVILDVDGTLIDSNEAHVAAWRDALGERGMDTPPERIRPLIGMGGDQLLPALLGIAPDDPLVKQLGERRSELFRQRYLPHLTPLPGIPALLRALHERGLRLVVASSASSAELDGLLALTGAAELIETETSADDAERSKPDPGIVAAALERLGLDAGETVMLGDTPYDIQAAAKVGVEVLALRCGGFADSDLAGALAIYDDPADLLAKLDDSPLGARASAAGR